MATTERDTDSRCKSVSHTVTSPGPSAPSFLTFHWPFSTVAPTVVIASVAMGGEQLGAAEWIARAPTAQASLCCASVRSRLISEDRFRTSTPYLAERSDRKSPEFAGKTLSIRQRMEAVGIEPTSAAAPAERLQA